MNREKILTKINELVERSLAPDCTVEELRSIKESIKEYKDMLESADVEARAAEAQTPPATAVRHNADVVASFTSATAKKEEKREENPLESMEYRQAFKNFVQRGVKIPAELRSKIADFRASLPEEQRAGVAITTNDTEAAIPVTVMREVINTIRKRYGNLYSKVRKMNVVGGVKIAVGALQADFKWIGEDTVSPRQKLDKLGSVTFGYHTAEIRIAQSFLSSILTVTDFETKVTEVIALAYLKAMDIAIVKGTGDGMPLGIVNDTRVTNVVTMTAAQFSNWAYWQKNFFAKRPLGYRGGNFIMSVGTVDGYVRTMADANNRPLYYEATGLVVNDGDAVNPNGRFYGHEIDLVEPDVVADFDTANSGDVVGIFWQPEEYGVNENFGFAMRRYFDEETNEYVNKALTVVDGKTLNPEGFVLIKKA